MQLQELCQAVFFLENDLMFYGVEFSSNSTKLYASGKLFSTTSSFANMQLQQYDLTATNIPSTKYIVYDYFQGQVIPSLAGSLQLGMDKRIYHSLPGNKISSCRFIFDRYEIHIQAFLLFINGK